MLLVENGIGGRTIEELAANMTDVEFDLWKARWKKEPFGKLRDDYHFARLMYTFIRVNTPKNKSVPSISKLLLKLGEKKQMNAEEMGTLIQSFVEPIEEE